MVEPVRPWSFQKKDRPDRSIDHGQKKNMVTFDHDSEQGLFSVKRPFDHGPTLVFNQFKN